jgi:predicted DNA-binding transcriptional regulator YafY
MMIGWNQTTGATTNNGFVQPRNEPSSRSAALSFPLIRLLQMLMILQSERYPNARRLAEACAVSRRTIYRDLATLDAAGITVLYRPERQGYQLARDDFLRPPQLLEEEAMALVLLSRHNGLDRRFGLQPHARTGAAKVVQVLPEEIRGRVIRSSELLEEEALDNHDADERRKIYELILRALSARKRLRLCYRDDEADKTLATILSIYRLARIARQWCLVGRSSAHKEIRSFLIARIEHLEMTDESYTIPPRFQMDRFLARTHRHLATKPREVILRFRAGMTSSLEQDVRDGCEKLVRNPEGSVELTLVIDAVDEIVLWVIGFGDQVEVVEPAELRAAVRNLIERMAQVYRGDRPPQTSDPTSVLITLPAPLDSIHPAPCQA